MMHWGAGELEPWWTVVPVVQINSCTQSRDAPDSAANSGGAMSGRCLAPGAAGVRPWPRTTRLAPGRQLPSANAAPRPSASRSARCRADITQSAASPCTGMQEAAPSHSGLIARRPQPQPQTERASDPN